MTIRFSPKQKENFFETLGYSVLLAQDGSEAFELTKCSPSPSIVFFDLNMPLLNGEYLGLKRLPHQRPEAILQSRVSQLVRGRYQTDC